MIAVAKKISIHPLTPERWSDFEALFGSRGACGGCWCMHWRQTNSEYQRNKGEANRQLMKRIVDSGEIPGLLAYVDGHPAGWCAVAPRERYPRLARSRILKPIDDAPVWSIVCFFVRPVYRGMGLTVEMLQAASSFARENDVNLLEGYPVEPKNERAPPVFVFTGLAAAFLRAGFREVARNSGTRPIMRKTVTE